HSEVYMLIGLEYLFLEDFDKALYYFKKCLKHNPHDHSALLNIIYCFEINDRYTDAIQYLESFLDDNPYNELAWQQLGKQLYVTKDYERSEERRVGKECKCEKKQEHSSIIEG